MTDLSFVWLLPLLPAAAGLASAALPAAYLRLLAPAVGVTLLPVGLLAAAAGARGPVRAGLLYVDGLSALLVTAVSLVVAVACLYSADYMEEERRAGVVDEGRLRRYYFWFYVFIASMYLVVLVANLGLLWVAVEATTLATAFLVGLHGDRAAVEAAWKYVVLCTVGIALALLGTIVLYYAALTVLGRPDAALSWPDVARVAPTLDPRLVRLAFVLVLVGYGTKAGLAPLHAWLPDAHSQAPAPVSALLSGVLISSAMYALIRFGFLAGAAVGPSFPAWLMLFFGLLSLLVAAPFLLIQRDLKRLLAYSSVEHMGVVAVGVGLAGLGGPAAGLAAFGAALHLVGHACAKASLFFAAGRLVQVFATRRIDRVAGAARLLPWLGTAFLAGILAVTGSPPFSLFASEFAIASAGLAGPGLLPTVVFLVLLGIIFGGMIYYGLRLALGNPPGHVARAAGPKREGSLMAVAAWAPLLLVFLAGLALPAPVETLLRQAGRVMAGGVVP